MQKDIFPQLVDNKSKGTMIDCLRESVDSDSCLKLITSEFEVSTFFELPEWREFNSTKILIGCQEKPSNKQWFLKLLYNNNENSIEKAKLHCDISMELMDLSHAITTGKIEVRGYIKEKLDGSVYLISNNNENIGGMIGSSNFTLDDLNQGIELNTRLSSEQAKGLDKYFDQLFNRAYDLGPEIIKQIERHIYPFTPYEIYLKSLYEYFRGREIPVGIWEVEQSKIYKILSEYQRDAYRQLLRIADTYKGALLCDGVGLGKTFVALMLIERMIQERKRVVVIVPKSAREAVWETALRRYIPDAQNIFGNFVVIYNHTDLLRGKSTLRDFPAEFEEIEQYADVLIIDEAHHFRTPWAKRSQKLFELSKGKLVFFLTATPINNTLFDLQHLIEFFTRRDDSRFAHLGINSIRGYLIQKESLIEQHMQVSEGIAKSEESIYSDFDTAYAERVLNDDRLFGEVVVQRSRSYVKQREAQSELQTIFPEPQPPIVADYSLKATYGPLLDLIRKVFDRDDPLLKLAIYYPLAYAKRPVDDSEERKEENRQKQVVGLVRTTMLKRFESSWKAFQYTCVALLLKLAASVRQLDEELFQKWQSGNTLWLNAIDVLMRERYDPRTNQEDVEEDDIFNLYIDEVPKLDQRLFDVDRLVQETLDDMDLLIQFLSYLKTSDSATDQKLQTLVNLLDTHPLLSQHKVVIFTEFRDTARYLASELRKAGFSNLEQIDSTSKVDRLDVIRRFAPFYNFEDPEKHQKALSKPIRVLISTDILSEGLNLQDAFLLINYDLHWNPVRLMQRIGRIDRRMNPEIETKLLQHDSKQSGLRGYIWYWNFLPPAELNNILSLYKRVAHKVLKISETTGLEGAQLLTPDDHFNTLKNFNESYEGRPSTDERLRLMLNEALKNDPDLEARLIDFPQRIFSAKDEADGLRGLFACYRLPALGVHDPETALGELRWYFLLDEDDRVLTSVDEIDQHISCHPQTPRIEGRPMADRYERLSLIERYIKTNELKKRKATTMAQVAGGTNIANRMQLVAWMDIN